MPAKEGRMDRVMGKRMLLVLLAVLIAASLFGCIGKPVPSDPEVIDITGTEEITAAPFVPSEEPTAFATSEPTEMPTPVATAVPTQAVNPMPAGKKIYLTFDDGPTKNTPTVLDILKRYNAKATFFTIGRMVEKNPNTLKRIYEEGHLIACHTMTHDLKIIYASPQAFLNDVADWREAVKAAIGSDVGSYCYRFPGGSPSAGGRKGRGAYVEAMHGAGYLGFDWNMGLNDAWLQGNTENLPVIDYLWDTYEETYSWYKNTEPLILIIHDTCNESVELLPRILEDLIAKGFEFGLVDELTEDYLM